MYMYAYADSTHVDMGKANLADNASPLFLDKGREGGEEIQANKL